MMSRRHASDDLGVRAYVLRWFRKAHRFSSSDVTNGMDLRGSRRATAVKTLCRMAEEGLLLDVGQADIRTRYYKVKPEEKPVGA